MVQAELPLWVQHSAAAAAAPGVSSSEKDDLLTSRAANSFPLWQPSSDQKKCAIYSVDLSKNNTFCTGGGDGTVRLWNVESLFVGKKGGSFESQGKTQQQYASTASSSHEEDSEEEDPAAATPRHPPKTPPPPRSTPQEGEPQQTPTRNVPQVHDLNARVRRKKDGSTPKHSVHHDDDTGGVPLGASLSPTKPFSGNTNNHRLVCTLSAHTGSSVLCVRFSPSGTYLASAGDDAAVCVYARSKHLVSHYNNNLQPSQSEDQQQWQRVKLCRGHQLDVVGLAWAPDDSHLVSCSLDSNAPLIVWKLTDLVSTQTQIITHPYKILSPSIHKSTVKGVTFDPAGTYLASSGDDPAVCIWRAHDDWGLERRIELSCHKNEGAPPDNHHKELSSQTLFRRLDWSTDGTYICSTNGMTKNKHVASTISRDGWSFGTNAHLVGHKQPIVVSRHCPYLLSKPSKEEEEEEEEDLPSYATLVALGDKRGFVTVWSTRQSRPLFKCQCSESRCTVTDLSWGRSAGRDILLLVSLLDGHVVALKFQESELGSFLSRRDQQRVFSLRYGIDFGEHNGSGTVRRFVGDVRQPQLIENALQYTLEEKQDQEEDDNDDNGVLSSSSDEGKPRALPPPVKSVQSETRVKGKKRIRPVLMAVDDAPPPEKPKKKPANGGTKKQSSDPVQEALASAERAASAAEGLRATAGKKRDASANQESVEGREAPHHHRHLPAAALSTMSQPQIPHSTRRIHSVELVVSSPEEPNNGLVAENGKNATFLADCTNVMHVPSGSSGTSIPCAVLSISSGGSASWKDELPGTSCTAIAASQTLLAVGTVDGAVYLYGAASPTLGWRCGAALRSHPPLIMGHAIVSLQLMKAKNTDESSMQHQVDMLVVTADGSFGIYSLLPDCKLRYKGTILPAMTHMALSSFAPPGDNAGEAVLPKLARIQITDSNHLLLILSLETTKSPSLRSSEGRSQQSLGAGGALQAFYYHRDMELWLRVSDSRFLLSDFYSSLPRKSSCKGGILTSMDNAVRNGATLSSLKPSSAARRAAAASATLYQHAEIEDGSNLATRSHCEDRLACALALGSSSEFQSWFVLYVRTLVQAGSAHHLRWLVDLLLAASDASPSSADETSTPAGSSSSCGGWLSLAPAVLDINCKELLRTVVIPEMSKNRALQRVTNEIAMDLEE